MLRLLLLRHAKSSWAKPGQDDLERPLAPRGERAAVALSHWLASQNLVPDRVLCSPARRTRDTLAALTVARPDRIAIAPGLYEPPSGDYQSVINKLGGDAKVLLVVGHNPAIQATATLLAGEGDPALYAEMAAKYPTGGLAILSFERSAWAGLRPKTGRLDAFVRPRDLPGGSPADD